MKKIFINPLIPRGGTAQRDTVVVRLEWLGYGVKHEFRAGLGHAMTGKLSVHAAVNGYLF